MRREDRSSISTYPLADLGWKLLLGLRHRLLLISRSSFVRAKGRSFVPACRTSIASRAGGNLSAARHPPRRNFGDRAAASTCGIGIEVPVIFMTANDDEATRNE